MPEVARHFGKTVPATVLDIDRKCRLARISTIGIFDRYFVIDAIVAVFVQSDFKVSVDSGKVSGRYGEIIRIVGLFLSRSLRGGKDQSQGLAPSRHIVDGICAIADKKGVGVRILAAVEHVVARAAVERVDARQAVESVCAIAAYQRVRSRIASEIVIQRRAEKIFDIEKAVVLGIVSRSRVPKQIDRNALSVAIRIH